MDERELKHFTMKVAIECNNVGVELLRSGCYRDAIATFRTATLLMQSAFKVTNQNGLAGNANLEVSMPSVALLKKAKEKLHLVGTLTISSYEMSHFDTSYYVSDPILMESATLSEDCSKCAQSAVMVFNMALACHLIGTASYLRKALSLYHTTLSIITQGGSKLNLCLRVTLPCLNNCGVIHHFLGHYEESRRFLNALSRELISLAPCAEGILPEYDLFYLNTALLTEPSIAAAA